MPHFKILRLNAHRNQPVGGTVHSSTEMWGSLEEALNELSAAGYTIALPVNGPVPGSEHNGAMWLEALILVNELASPIDDLDRRIGNVTKLIANAERDLASHAPNSPDWRSAKSQIEMSTPYLLKLQTERGSTISPE